MFNSASKLLSPVQKDTCITLLRFLAIILHINDLLILRGEHNLDNLEGSILYTYLFNYLRTVCLTTISITQII
jgi:hypothetical protein